MNDALPRRRVVLTIAAAAFALRLAVGEFALSKGRAFLPDSELYWGYAESLAERGTFQVGGAGARRTPGYPLFIAACTKMSFQGDPTVPPTKGQLRAVLVAQALLAAAVSAMVFALGCRLFGTESTAPAFAAMLSAVDPFAAAVSSMVLAETLFTASFVAAVWCGSNASRGTGWCIAAGIMAGIAVMARPSGLLLVPIGLVFLVWKWGWKCGVGAAVAFSAVMTPWIARNVNVYGKFVPTTLNVGESLYDGWNPDADGSSNMAFVELRKKEVGAAATPAEEADENERWKREAVAWAKEHPERAAWLATVKLWRFWSPWPNAAEFQSPLVVVGCTAFSLVAYVGAAVGVVVLWRQGNWAALAVGLIPILYFMALHAAFVSSVRYRVPAMPTFVLLAGAGIAWLWNRPRVKTPAVN